MNGRRTEMQHNTLEQVRDYLREALDLVDELGPGDDLRGVCLAKAIDLISAKQIVMEQITPSVLGHVLPPGR